MISGPRTLLRKLKIGSKLVSDDALHKAGGVGDIVHSFGLRFDLPQPLVKLELLKPGGHEVHSVDRKPELICLCGCTDHEAAEYRTSQSP
jgi:hypothetical protein